MRKHSYSLYSLSTMGTGALLSLVEEIANDMFDGHYTIFKFTTGYKGTWGTPDMRNGCSEVVEAWETFRVLDTLLIFMIAMALDLDNKK